MGWPLVGWFQGPKHVTPTKHVHAELALSLGWLKHMKPWLLGWLADCLLAWLIDSLVGWLCCLTGSLIG